MPLFTYNENIPDGPNNPSVDQPKMKTNTNSTFSLIDVDHFTFNDANGGLHKQVNLVTEASPARQGDLVVYTKIFNAQSVLWSKNSLQDIPMYFTANSAVTGHTSTLGGIIIQWGQGTTNASGDGTINFTPAFGTFFSASLTRIETAGDHRGFIQFTALPTNASGTVKMRDTNGVGIAGTFLWVAIGSTI